MSRNGARADFCLLFFAVCLDGFLMYLFAELIETAGSPRGLCFWLFLAFDHVFPPRLFNQDVGTGIVLFIRKANGLLGYILLGLIFHVIREAFRDHNLRISRYIFLSTQADARR